MHANTDQVLTDEQIDVILYFASDPHPSVLELRRLARTIESAVLSSLDAASEPLTEPCNALMESWQSRGELESMLSDYEALEGVEAWLNQQELRIKMGLRGPESEIEPFVESAAGWLLRLVQHASAGRSPGEVNSI